MKFFFIRLADKILLLPPLYFYIGWAAGFLLILLLLYRSHLEPSPVSIGTTNSQLSSQAGPETMAKTAIEFEQVLGRAAPATKLRAEIDFKLQQLANFFSRRITSEQFAVPDWINPEFTCSGVDRIKFKTRYSKSSISVQRWQTSESAPQFSGSQAFEELTKSCFMAWQAASDFRIEFTPIEIQIEQSQVRIGLSFECVARISPNKCGQGSGIWQTNWILMPDSTLQLVSISVAAQEEVEIAVAGGKLFQDCTSSILANCDSLPGQLAYGLDQWAKRIPYLDIVGNQGISIGDVNQDGLDDLYVCQGHGLPNLLLVQDPNGTVRDVSHDSGVDILDQSFGALMIDLDNDGDQDLVVSTDEGLLLLANNGFGYFQLEKSLPIGRGAQNISAADYDQDGDLDLFLCKPFATDRVEDWIIWPTKFDAVTDGGRNVLLRNEEAWQFVDVTEQAGITTNNQEFTRCAVWLDFDLDGDQDLYLTNEFSSDRLLRNDRGWFSDATAASNLSSKARHRTVSVGEFNQDGKLDFFVGTDTTLRVPDSVAVLIANSASDPGEKSPDKARIPPGLPAAIQQIFSGESRVWFSQGENKQPPTGSAPVSANSSGLYRPFLLRAPIFDCGSTNGSCAVDLNNDGLDDLVVSNGFLSRSSTEDVGKLLFDGALDEQDVAQAAGLQTKISHALHTVLDMSRAGYSFSGHQRNRCFLGLGTTGFANFSNVSGLDFLDDGRALATSDWDHDGDVDVFMTCRTSPQLRILCNQSGTENKFISFELMGTMSNRDAIGTRIELFCDGSKVPFVKVLQAGSGFLSQSSKRLTCGLGESKLVAKVVVTWPNGTQQTFEKLKINSRYLMVEGKNELVERNNDRFNLSINTTIKPLASNQPTSQRSIFYPSPALPKLMFQGAIDKFFPLRAVKEQPLLVMFFGTDESSLYSVRQLGKSVDRISDAGLDCVGVMCDPAVSTAGDKANAAWNRAESIVKDLNLPFRWGVLTPASIEKLKYCAGDWFSDQQLPQLPFGLLLDSTDRVVGYYPGSVFTLKSVINDLPLLAADERIYASAASPLSGRWMARYRYPELSRLGIRLAEIGYPDDADAMMASEIPFQAYLLCNRGIEKDMISQAATAKAMFETAIANDPFCVPALVQLGHVQRKLALQEMASNPGKMRVMQQQALADYARALQIDPYNSEAVLGLAEIAIDQKQFDVALQQLMAYIQIDPTRYEVHAVIGRLYFYLKNYVKAAEYLVTAFDNRPSLPFVAGDLGLLYLNGGDYKNARKFLLLAHRLQPSDENLTRFLSEAEFLTGNYSECMQLLQKVIEAEPNRQRSKFIMAWILATCPIESVRSGEQSLGIILPLVELYGDSSPAILEIYAAGLAESGRFDEALAIQKKSLTLLEEGKFQEPYSSAQRDALIARRELYFRQRPYRTGDPQRNPISAPGLGFEEE